MWQILKNIFSPEQYMPHGHCYLWQTPLVGLHVVSDFLIAIAYFSIPAMLAYFVLKRPDVPFLKVFVLFGAFIICCGIGHLLEIWTLWHPAYWLSGVEQGVTALVSCYTAASMVTLLPQFLSLKSPDELESINQELQREIQERLKVEAELRRAYDQLDGRVRERTKELVKANKTLETEVRERKRIQSKFQQIATREQTISRVVGRMRRTLDLETIFTATTQELRQALGCDRVLVYRFNPDWSGELVAESVTKGWKRVVSPKGSDPKLTKIAIDESGCTIATLARTKNPLQDTYLQQNQGRFYELHTTYRSVRDIYQANFDSCYLELLERLQARAYTIVPIICGRQLWGLLAAYQNSQPRDWQEAEIQILMQIGAQLGVAVQQAQLLARTQQQTAELQVAKESADAANRAKSEFLANMSHELRTPLNAILGFTQLMNREPNINPEHREYLETIDRSGEHLLVLINDILDMSKIEAGRVTLNEDNFDLYYLLENLEDLLQLKAKSKGVQLVFECADDLPRYVRADESKLRQVLINLLGNAIKFTREGWVSLGVKPAGMAGNAQDSIWLEFEVEDTGPGIAAEERSKLFEAFAQTETGLHSGQGTGLGLPISQKFVELMGGEIRVKSELNRGSTFSFAIRVSRVEKASVVAEEAPDRGKVIGLAPGEPSYRILIAEDRRENRQILVKLLSSIGFEVREAIDGQEAIAIWEAWQPHLIWMDMRMPNLDGYEATRQIKALEAARSPSEKSDTIIIALTANAFDEDRRIAISAGCDDFVCKPFRERELLAKIRQHLGAEYIYEEGDPSDRIEVAPEEMTREELQEAIAALPQAWVEQLHCAALQCSDASVLELLEQLEDEQAPIVAQIARWVDNFQFDAIVELVQHSAMEEATL
ncbi:MAG: ATP-binding protein [Cyanobacteriota bacterium]|nr:ATP-binding protein [Cyanobacteriota bacterium]